MDQNQLLASPEPAYLETESARRPPGGSVGGVEWDSGAARRALPVQRARRPPPPSAPGACVGARPGPHSPPVPGDAAQRPPGAGALPSSPLGAGARPSARRTQPAAATVYSCGHAPAQLRRVFAFAPPLPPLPSLSPEEEALRVPGSLPLYCAAQGYAFL